MKSKVLSQLQIEQFIELGWVKLEEAYSCENAEKVADFIWGRIEEQGVMRDDRSTWTLPMVHLKRRFEGPELDACHTEKLSDAIEDLIGENRWLNRVQTVGWGWWPINFSVGADEAWDVPLKGWHYDGQDFHHYLNSADEGLLRLCLFSEVKPGGGGTLIAEGSHHIVAKVLEEFPEGIEHGEAIRLSLQHPWLAKLTGKAPLLENAVDHSTPSISRIDYFMNQTYIDSAGASLRVIETTGNPGDVFLVHPFLFHAASQNHLAEPRMMCNRKTPTKEKMKFNRNNPNEYSPVELSIKKALERSK